MFKVVLIGARQDRGFVQHVGHEQRQFLIGQLGEGRGEMRASTSDPISTSHSLPVVSLVVLCGGAKSRRLCSASCS